MKWDFQIYVLALVLFNEMGFSDTCNVLALVLIKEMGFSDTKCTCTSISVDQ
jgi:hypothetical protein